MRRVSHWIACWHCSGGRAYWEPLAGLDKLNRRGTYTCVACSRSRDETDDEVRKRTGKEVHLSPEDKLRQELDEVRAQLAAETDPGTAGQLSDLQVERMANKGADALKIYKAVRDRRLA